MPITIAHQPPAWAIANPALEAGLGQYRQQQFQNGMAVMQMALAERARQQDQAYRQQQSAIQQQQFQQQLDAQRAQQDMHSRLAAAQMMNQQAMNNADNQAAWDRTQYDAQQRAQNYEDLRNHQSDMQSIKIASTMGEANKQQRLKQLAGVASNANPQGRSIAEQLKNDLGVLSARFAMGEIDPETYSSALQEWDSKFSAEGDWKQYQVNPTAQMQSEFDASLFQHPQYGPGRFAKKKDGTTIFIPEGPKSEMRDGVKWIGIPDPDNGLWAWKEGAEPKPPAPAKPVKKEFTLKDVRQLAQEMAMQARPDPMDPTAPLPGPDHYFDQALAQLQQQDQAVAEAKGQGQQTSMPQQQQPAAADGEAPPQAQMQQPPAQQNDPTIKPQTIQEGTPESAVWDFISEVANAKPENSDLVNQIKLQLATKRPVNDPKVRELIQTLHQRMQQDAARKGLLP